MKRWGVFPIWAQVAVLAGLCIIASQLVVFGLVLFAPDPRPAGFSATAVAEALDGRPARTSDGRPLTRRLANHPLVTQAEPDALERLIQGAIARRLSVDAGQVRVKVERPRRMRTREGSRPPIVIMRSDITGLPQSETTQDAARDLARDAAAAARADAPTGAARFLRFQASDRFDILTDRLDFPPFSASVRLQDGRWANVAAPRDLIAPWQMRLLLALGISVLLVAPLVWWLSRRLTRPIRTFAEAAQRLGADPDAPPLRAVGPAEVRTAIDAFNDMQGSLRDHVRKRTQTVAAIAHDLRTPLTRLRFRAEQAPGAVRDRMNADIDEMDALIGQAMAYVRGEAAPERRERLDLAALVRDCAEGYVETGAAVEIAAAAALPIEGDVATLRRALTNLIDNALKYGDRARVRTLAEDGWAVVLIDDDGPGLPDDELEAVFEPFHRAERSRNRETGGAGLGLTVARQAARAHQGDVRLISRAEGLTARFAVPLAT